MNKVAIISDSHGSLDRFEECLKNLRDGGVKHVIHGGDCVVDGFGEILDKFSDLNFFIARGNCDVSEEEIGKIKKLANVNFDEVLEFEIEGVKFVASHRIEDSREIQDAKVHISGHTHIPQIFERNGKLFLNPGSLMDSGRYILFNLESFEVEGKVFSEKIK